MSNLNWNEYFMNIAFVTSLRSKDPVTKVGTVIVNPDNKIVGTGYNGFPSGCNEVDFTWNKDSNSILGTKYPFVVHSELNAILNSTSDTLKGSTIYTTLYPCNECAKAIVQKSIKKVIYLNNKSFETDIYKASQMIFKSAKVITEKFEGRLINFELP